jgi:diguanylate cyclase (GGDEF)-like protein
LPEIKLPATPSRRWRFLMLLGAVILLPLISIFDFWLGPEFEFTFFYLALIVAITWYGDRKIAITLLVISTLVIFEVNILSDGPNITPLSAIWQTLFDAAAIAFTVVVVLRLKEALQREGRLARTDNLTGLANRRYFEERAKLSLEWSRRHNDPITLAYVDLDNFKQVNDQHGHEEGDRLLVELAQSIKENLRQTDLVARLGGDEFVLFLPETEEKTARTVIERMRNSFVAKTKANGWPVTMSIGAITDYALTGSLNELINAADNLMYEAKNSGKNSAIYRRHGQRD